MPILTLLTFFLTAAVALRTDVLSLEKEEALSNDMETLGSANLSRRRYGQCERMDEGYERCMFAAGSECQDIPHAGFSAVAGYTAGYFSSFTCIDTCDKGDVVKPACGPYGEERSVTHRLIDDEPFKYKDVPCSDFTSGIVQSSWGKWAPEKLISGDTQCGVELHTRQEDQSHGLSFQQQGIWTTNPTTGNSTPQDIDRRGNEPNMKVHIQTTSIGSIFHDACCHYYVHGQIKGADGNVLTPEQREADPALGVGCKGGSGADIKDSVMIGAAEYNGGYTHSQIITDTSGETFTHWREYLMRKEWFHGMCGPEWAISGIFASEKAQHPVTPVWSSCEASMPDNMFVEPSARAQSSGIDTVPEYGFASKLSCLPQCEYRNGRNPVQYCSVGALVHDTLYDWEEAGLLNPAEESRNFLSLLLTGKHSKPASAPTGGSWSQVDDLWALELESKYYRPMFVGLDLTIGNKPTANILAANNGVFPFGVVQASLTVAEADHMQVSFCKSCCNGIFSAHVHRFRNGYKSYYCKDQSEVGMIGSVFSQVASDEFCRQQCGEVDRGLDETATMVLRRTPSGRGWTPVARERKDFDVE